MAAGCYAGQATDLQKSAACDAGDCVTNHRSTVDEALVQSMLRERYLRSFGQRRLKRAMRRFRLRRQAKAP
eukprot:2141296-Pleurochrysis_carterae.AAC.1